jgi:hypothetical protein
MPIPAVTYVLSTAYAAGVIAAKVAYGSSGQTFDVLAALVAGGGDARGVGGAFAVTDADLAAALDESPVLDRSGAASPPPQTLPVTSPVLATETVKADGDILVRSGSTFAVLAKPGSPTGERLIVRTDGTVAWGAPPEFHVAAWGAIGDNTADDRQAIRDAYVACENAGGGYVVLGGRNGKTHKFGPTATNPVPISRNGTSGVIGSRGWVIVKGNGATITLTSQVYRAWDCQRVADYDVFARVGFEDVTVDAGNVARTDNNHVFAGNLVGNWTQRQSFRWWYFKNCRTINVPAANTDGDGTSTTGSRQSVSLGSRHNGTGEATQTFVRDIYDIDCNFGGAGGVFAGGTGAGTSSVNVFCDNLRSYNLVHDPGVTPSTPPNSTPTHFAIQHGGTGFGGSSTVIGLRSKTCNDAALEQDEMQTVYNEDCIVQDAWNVAFLPRAFGSGRVDLSAQIYTYKSCWNVVKNIDPPATSTFQGNAFGWCQSGTQTINHIVLEQCGNLNKAASLRVNGEAISIPETPVRKLTLRDFKAIHETVNYSPGSAPTWSFIRYAPSIANEFDARGVHYSLNGTYGGPSATGRFITFEGAGPTTISYDDPVYECPISWAAGTLYAEWYGQAAGAANVVITSGAVRRRKARNFTSNAPNIKARGFTGSPALTITNELIDQDCDNTGFPSATAQDILFGANDNRPKVKSRGGTALQSTTVASAATITLPDKGDFISITGTTNITSVTASWTGRVVTLKFAGALTFTDGSNLLLAGNLTTANNTTITLICDGTNWLEMSRSAN